MCDMSSTCMIRVTHVKCDISNVRKHTHTNSHSWLVLVHRREYSRYLTSLNSKRISLHTHMHTHTHTATQPHSHTAKQTHYTQRHTERHTETQRHTETYRDTHTPARISSRHTRLEFRRNRCLHRPLQAPLFAAQCCACSMRVCVCVCVCCLYARLEYRRNLHVRVCASTCVCVQAVVHD